MYNILSAWSYLHVFEILDSPLLKFDIPLLEPWCIEHCPSHFFIKGQINWPKPYLASPVFDQCKLSVCLNSTILTDHFMSHWSVKTSLKEWRSDRSSWSAGTLMLSINRCTYLYQYTSSGKSCFNWRPLHFLERYVCKILHFSVGEWRYFTECLGYALNVLSVKV